MVVALGLLGLSKYVFQAHLRPDGIVLFVAMVWVSAFVLDRLQSEDTGTRVAVTGSEKLQSQKMEAIGRLAGGVAHDFNNLLAVINGYSDLLLENVGSSDPNRAKLEQIKQAANSAASLTRQLLMFSRQQVIQPVILDINQIVANTEKMVRRLIKENIDLEGGAMPQPASHFDMAVALLHDSVDRRQTQSSALAQCFRSPH
jgi:signal transduction histidine kinase